MKNLYKQPRKNWERLGLPKGLSAQQVYTQTYDQIRNEINDNAKKEYEDTVEQVKPEVTEQVSPEQEVETVQELLNRPVTLTELGGSKLETPQKVVCILMDSKLLLKMLMET